MLSCFSCLILLLLLIPSSQDECIKQIKFSHFLFIPVAYLEGPDASQGVETIAATQFPPFKMSDPKSIPSPSCSYLYHAFTSLYLHFYVLLNLLSNNMSYLHIHKRLILLMCQAIVLYCPFSSLERQFSSGQPDMDNDE